MGALGELIEERRQALLPPVVQGWQGVPIRPHHAGFGMWQADPPCTDIYDTWCDIFRENGLSSFFDDGNKQAPEEAQKAIDAVRECCHNAPTMYVAVWDEYSCHPDGRTGEWVVEGAEPVDCYEREDGSYVKVEDYEQDPLRYDLLIPAQ